MKTFGWISLAKRVIQAASRWREVQENVNQRLRITIIDLEAEKKTDSLFVRYPHLDEASEIEALQMDVHSADFQRGEFLFNEVGQCDVDSVYVCMDNDSLAPVVKRCSPHDVPQSLDVERVLSQ